jgi:hypothetical protein
VSTIDRIAIRRVAVERATVISGQSFDAVLAKLASAIGHPDDAQASAVAAQLDEKIMALLTAAAE